MNWGIIPNHIMSYHVEKSGLSLPDLTNGFHYEVSERAIDRMVDRISSSPTKRSVIFDVDDTLVDSFPFLVQVLSLKLKTFIEGFSELTLDEVVMSGGKVYKMPRVIEAATHLGTTAKQLWHDVLNDFSNRAAMTALPMAKELQAKFIESGIPIAAYLTARDFSMASVTTKNLQTLGFLPAPVVCIDGTGNPTEEKLRILHLVKSRISSEHRIIFIDDRVETALAVYGQFSDMVEIFVPMTAKNKKDLHQLPSDIINGTHQELIQEISNKWTR